MIKYFYHQTVPSSLFGNNRWAISSSDGFCHSFSPFSMGIRWCGHGACWGGGILGMSWRSGGSNHYGVWSCHHFWFFSVVTGSWRWPSWKRVRLLSAQASFTLLLPLDGHHPGWSDWGVVATGTASSICRWRKAFLFRHVPHKAHAPSHCCPCTPDRAPKGGGDRAAGWQWPAACRVWG